MQYRIITKGEPQKFYIPWALIWFLSASAKCRLLNICLAFTQVWPWKLPGWYYLPNGDGVGWECWEFGDGCGGISVSNITEKRSRHGGGGGGLYTLGGSCSYNDFITMDRCTKDIITGSKKTCGSRLKQGNIFDCLNQWRFNKFGPKQKGTWKKCLSFCKWQFANAFSWILELKVLFLDSNKGNTNS